MPFACTMSYYPSSLCPYFFLGVILIQIDGRLGASSPPRGLYADYLGLDGVMISGEGDLALPPALQLVHRRLSFLFCQGDGKNSGLRGGI